MEQRTRVRAADRMGSDSTPILDAAYCSCDLARKLALQTGMHTCGLCGSMITAQVKPSPVVYTYVTPEPEISQEPIVAEGQATGAVRAPGATKIATAAEAGIELLWRWLPVILGGGAPIEPTIPSGRANHGRPDVVDKRHMDLAAALEVLRRLGAVYAYQPVYAEFLWAAYHWHRGHEALGWIAYGRSHGRQERVDRLVRDKGKLRDLRATDGREWLAQADRSYDGAADFTPPGGWFDALRRRVDQSIHWLDEDTETARQRRQSEAAKRALERKQATSRK